MTAELARAGGAVGALGVAALVLGGSRPARAAGLLAWALGCATLALWLAPADHHRAYAAAAAAGAALAVALAWAFARMPWLLAVAVLGFAPARIPVSVGDTTANLLLPMYVVVAGAALALAWQLLRGEQRVRELGPLAWPVALFVAWSGVAFLWSQDRRQGAIYLLFYVLPFALVAVSLARIPWSTGWAGTLYVQLAGMAFAFAVIGIWQYSTRNLFWNPKVIVDNAYATSSWFYRVNSVFYDPSIYGRFLVVALLAGLVLVLFGGRVAAWAALALVAVTWVGLVPSFSQSSFAALGAGAVVALAALWRRRSILPIALAVGALLAVSLGVPQARHRILGKAGLSHATGGRSKLVSNGLEIVARHPVVGVGTGGFRRAYAKQTHLRGKEPKAAASHDTPITVAAETGIPGLALLAWLLAAALVLPFRRNPVRTATGRARLALGLALVAIAVHSLFYDALFEDPLFWVALALSAVAARAEVAG
ncbi:MAG TPA: O-antigen ligase family protein [Gaiellaceae bacterium]|nr:O-antigen ligase family protein [Gaiellaceae bacterium]